LSRFAARATTAAVLAQEPPLSSPRLIAILATAAVVAGLAVGGFAVMRGSDDRFADCRRATIAGGSASIGGPFSLVDPQGRRVTDAEAITRPTLVYFGYSFCPDFCPTDLARNALAADALAERGVDVGQVFVSIDPERDTPEVVGDFVAAIHPGLLGLTGTPEQVDSAAKAYRVFYRKAGDDPTYYMMEHSTFTYLMAPEVGFLEFYSSELGPEELADSVACFAAKL
jgi:protein SCO1